MYAVVFILTTTGLWDYGSNISSFRLDIKWAGYSLI